MQVPGLILSQVRFSFPDFHSWKRKNFISNARAILANLKYFFAATFCRMVFPGLFKIYLKNHSLYTSNYVCTLNFIILYQNAGHKFCRTLICKTAGFLRQKSRTIQLDSWQLHVVHVHRAISPRARRIHYTYIMRCHPHHLSVWIMITYIIIASIGPPR